jgi:hypothetical protein
MLNTLRSQAFTAMECNKVFYYVHVNNTIPLLSPHMIDHLIRAPLQMYNYLLLKGRSCAMELRIPQYLLQFLTTYGPLMNTLRT